MNEISLYQRIQDPLAGIEKLGNFFARSGLFGCDRAEQGQVLAMICLAENKSPTDITRNYDIVDGKLRKRALAALGEFRLRGGKHKWLRTGADGLAAELQLTFDGETITSKFTIEEAKLQNLVRPNSNWVKTPGNMLRARAISNGIAMLAPEIYAGEEDTQDAPPSAALNLVKATVTASAPTQPTASATPAAPSEAKPVPAQVIDVQATVETPTAPAAAAAPAFNPGPAYTPPANTPQLSADLQGQVENIIGALAVPAMKWMWKEGWLQEGQGLEHLPEARARRIVKQRDTFIARITEFAAANP